MEINTATFNLGIVGSLVFFVVLKQMNLIPKMMKVNLSNIFNYKFKYGVLIALALFFILTYFSINKIDLTAKPEEAGEMYKIGTLSI